MKGRAPAALALALWLALPAALSGEETGRGFAAGAWSHELTTISAEVPGIPQFLIRMFAGERSRKSCLTDYQATHTPHVLMMQDGKSRCRTTRFVMAGGRFDWVAQCSNKRFPEGLTIESTGRYAPASYAIDSTATGTREGRPVRIVTRGSGRRTGLCAG